jgi:hypothetical protein
MPLTLTCTRVHVGVPKPDEDRFREDKRTLWVSTLTLFAGDMFLAEGEYSAWTADEAGAKAMRRAQALGFTADEIVGWLPEDSEAAA